MGQGQGYAPQNAMSERAVRRSDVTLIDALSHEGFAEVKLTAVPRTGLECPDCISPTATAQAGTDC